MAEHIEELLERLEKLELEVTRLKKRDELENLASRYQYYWTAGEGQRIVEELWTKERRDASLEIGPSGVFIGVPRLSTYYMNERRPGRLLVHTMTTPDVVVSQDGQTAKGLWITVGSESESGDLGPEPPQTPEARRLLTSRDAQGNAYRAEWVWQKFEGEFVRENGQWRIWHLHLYEIFRCPFDTDWVRFSELRKETDGLRCDALFTPEIEPDLPPGFPREYNPEFGSTYHWQYAADAVAELRPEPPAEAV